MTNSTVELKKLNGRKLLRGRGFTVVITKAGYVGQVFTETVTRYGHTQAAQRIAAEDPFKQVRRCTPVGSDKPAKQCPTNPGTGP